MSWIVNVPWRHVLRCQWSMMMNYGQLFLSEWPCSRGKSNSEVFKFNVLYINSPSFSHWDFIIAFPSIHQNRYVGFYEQDCVDYHLVITSTKIFLQLFIQEVIMVNVRAVIHKVIYLCWCNHSNIVYNKVYKMSRFYVAHIYQYKCTIYLFAMHLNESDCPVSQICPWGKISNIANEARLHTRNIQ